MELARLRLSDYPLQAAIDAICDVDETTPEQIPDELLAKAARRHLETINDQDGGDPGAALREVRLDKWWSEGAP